MLLSLFLWMAAVVEALLSRCRQRGQRARVSPVPSPVGATWTGRCLMPVETKGWRVRHTAYRSLGCICRDASELEAGGVSKLLGTLIESSLN